MTGYHYETRPAHQDAPLSALWSDGELPAAGGDLVRSLTYRQTYTPALPAADYYRSARRRPTADAPDLLRTAAGGAWALVSMTAAGGVLLLLVVVVARLLGFLT